MPLYIIIGIKIQIIKIFVDKELFQIYIIH